MVGRALLAGLLNFLHPQADGLHILHHEANLARHGAHLVGQSLPLPGFPLRVVVVPLLVLIPLPDGLLFFGLHDPFDLFWLYFKPFGDFLH